MTEELTKLIVFGKSPNPELEELRDSVPQPPPVNEDVEELMRVTSRVHVGFLFTAKGLPALQQICKFVLSAEEYTGGWREFAANLGLDPVAVQCMRNSGNMTRVCELILEAFAQKEDASLDRVISCLHKMNRVDVIYQSKSPLLDLVDAVLKDHDLGYVITAGENQRGLIIPHYLPEVSITFKNLTAIKDVQTVSSQPQRQDMERQQEPFEVADRDVAQLQDALQEYAYLVMLTFADDGAEAARRIAKIFRQTRASDGSRVGVVLLHEHSFRINTYGNQYVLGFFNDVNYVVPIVTKGYMDIVMGRRGPTTNAQPSCLDHKYARYVYQQMQAEYMNKNCVNERVRPVIVDSYIVEAQHEFLMGDALFQSWCAESHVAELAERLLWED